MLRCLLGYLTCAALLSVLTPGPALAHQVLRSSAPAEGDTLSSAPREVRLTFAQSVEPSLAQLRLVGPNGEVALGPLAVPGDSTAVMRAAVEGGLVPGAYTVHWLATGDDGHPVRGEFHFVIRADAAGLVPAAVAPSPADTESIAAAASQESVVGKTADAIHIASAAGPRSLLYTIGQWLDFAGIVMVIGAVTFATLLLPRVRRAVPGADALVEQMRRRAAVVGLVGALFLLAALPLRLGAQAAALAGAGSGSRADLLRNILARSAWGWGWSLAAAAGLLAVAALLLARRGVRAGWIFALMAALVLSVTPALSGHAAAASPLAVLADSVHVLSAGGWLGTLLVMMLAGLPPILANTTTRRATAGALLSAFSPLALTFAGALALTGTYSAWLHLPSASALWTSEYGQILLFKLAALLVVLAAGAYSWRRARPALQQRDDPRPLRRSAAVELVFGALVLAITSALVATAPPSESGAHVVGAADPGGTAALADRATPQAEPAVRLR